MAATAAALFVSFWIMLGLSILLADVSAYRRTGPLHKPPRAIEKLDDGEEVKLVGTVRLADDALKAPVSGKPCAGYEVRVARRRLMRWRPVRVARERVGFFLDDGTGEVFVRLDEGAQVQLVTSARYRASRKLRRSIRGVLGNLLQEAPARSYRCDEGALTEGARVAVYGVARQVSDARPEREDGYRARRYRFVVESAREGLYVSDERAALG
ncbi:MAG: GIDE domain-containing protein [Myxococcota bacterium]